MILGEPSILACQSFAEAVDGPDPINLWWGSVRSSKTVTSILAYLDLVATWTGRLHGNPLLVAKTLDTLKRNILEPMAEFDPDGVNYSIAKREAVIYGQACHLVGANDEKSEAKIRGMTVPMAYGDEVSLWPESFFGMLLSRLSTEPGKFLGTTNPDSPQHWLRQNFILNPDPDVGVAHWLFTLDDNPHLDPAFVRRIKAQYKAMGALWYKRYIRGLWVAAEGAVYGVFDESKHVRLAQEWDRYIVGIDYGASAPTTYVLIGYSVRGGVLRAQCVREYYHDPSMSADKTHDDHVKDLGEWLGGVQPVGVYVDPSATALITALQRAGYPAVRGNNSVNEGIAFVTAAIASGWYSIAPECKNNLREKSGYVWDPTATAKGEDKPLKESDHVQDAERYALKTHLGSGKTSHTLISGFMEE